MGESEKAIEQYLCRQIEKLGGEAYKFVSPNRRAVTDRICVLPNNIIVFVELKSEGLRPSDAQFRELQRLRTKGVWAEWVDKKIKVDILIEYIKEAIEYGTSSNRNFTPDE